MKGFDPQGKGFTELTITDKQKVDGRHLLRKLTCVWLNI